MNGVFLNSRFFLLTMLLAGSLGAYACSGSSDSPAEEPVYPMFVDTNSNKINDYFERASHDPGSLARMGGVGTGSHAYVDEDNDGVCDHAQNGSATWHGPGYLDEDGDGICDYWDQGSGMHNRNRGMNYLDNNGNGINDYMEQQSHVGIGHDYIDEDGDGVCDHAQDGTAGIYHGPGYNDEDGNGICDNWQEGGMGYGGGMGGSPGPGGHM
ncbi:MAG: hypothetical protein OEZ32_13905 [Nitrospinota bacterium]|nr:hypothetical protein [Nitrospinota bacterium]